MIPIQEAAVNPHVHRISAVCASQMAKTDTLMNVIGATLDDDPAPIIYVGPTRSNVEKIIEPRLMAMIRSSPELKRTYAAGKASSKTAKRINGVLCRLAWAGSATELASQEAKLAIMDEIDRMGFDVQGEGSPIELVDARLATFPGSKLILTSTPTEGNVVEETDPRSGLVHWGVSPPDDIGSTIWRLWQEGSRHEWAWPCPECSQYFVPRFKLLKWPEDSTPAQVRRNTRLVCPHCSFAIEDSAKAGMNARGRFVAPGQSVSADGVVSPELESTDSMSYWISGLASPWKSWGQRAANFVIAARSHDPGRIQAVLNTDFGELFRTGGAAPAWQDIRILAGGYITNQFPTGPLTLTAGVDVQKERLIYCVRGWSYELESWLVEHGELVGPTHEDEVWTRLSDKLNQTWGGLSIRLMAIDSGYRPGDKFRRPDHKVYEFCRRHAGRAVPTKGHDQQNKPLHSALIDVKVNGAVIKQGIQLWHLDSDYFKSWVHARLALKPTDPGQWHLPADITDDYCQQITAEAKSIKASGKAVWIVIRRENHILDCEALNVAAAHMLALQTLHTRPSTDASTNPEAIKPQMPVPIVPRVQLPRGSNWTMGWRR